MKKIILLTMALGVLVFLPVMAFAETPPGQVNVLDPACQGVTNSTLCNDNKPQDANSNSIYGPNGILTKAASIISIIVGVVCVIAIIIGGVRYVLSGGDSQQTTNAKNAILYAIIGLVITLTARGILLFVLRRIS